jgi:WD40 repeat protein/serine/threonine protein kinase
MSDVDARADFVDQLAEEFLARYRRGEHPAVQEYTEKYPEHAAQIRDLFPALVVLEQAAPASDSESLSACTASTGISSAGVPEELGDYRIVREIGRGGMGVVYEAEQQSLGRRVALKVLLGNAAQDAKVLARFRRESRAAAQLHHTNIVPIHEVGEQAGLCYYTMQFIRGQALDEVFRELQHLRTSSVSGAAKEAPTDPQAQSLWTGKFESAGSGSGTLDHEPGRARSPAASAPRRAELSAALPDRSELSSVTSNYRRFCRNAARLGLQAAEALAYAHGRGVIHRDIKPANLLLDTTGVLWISDFGLAKTQDPALTETGDVLGTLRYMAPERFRGECDIQADVYALGLTLYELLVLRPAFDGTDRLRLVEQIGRQEPARLRTLDPRIPRDLETIIMKAIEKDPRRRYPSAEAMAADLRRFLADEPILARRTGPLERLGRWGRRNPLVAGLSAAIVMVAALGFVGVLGQWQVALAHEQEAKKNEKEANRRRDEVLALNDKLRATQAELRSILYAADMNLANHAWEEAAVPRVVELLEKYHPKPGELDLRHFEWHFLNRLRHADPLLTLRDDKDEDFWNPVWVAFSPGGKRLISTTGGGTNFSGIVAPELRLWDAQTGQLLLSAKGHGGTGDNVVFSPDGKRLASGSNKGEPDKQVVGEVKLWNAETGQELLSLKGHIRDVNSVAFSPDGKRLASASFDNMVKVWDAQTGRELLSLEGGSGGVAFSPDGKRLANSIGGRLKDGMRVPGVVKVWDAQTGRELLSLKGGGLSIAFSPDGTRLASRSARGLADSHPVTEDLKVWDAQTGQELPNLNEKSDGSLFFAFSPDGKRLATASQRSKMPRIRVWDAQTGQEIYTLQGHTAEVNSLAFSPDSKYLATASDDRTLRLWDLETGREIRTLKGHNGEVSSVVFSPDGKRLASSGSDDDTVRVWDVQQRPVTLDLMRTGGGSPPVGVFSPDFSRLAGAAANNTVKIWDARTGRETLSLKGHTGHVTSVIFSPDSKRLASSSNDNTVKVWNAQTGQELLTIKRHTGVWSMAFSPDGKRLASGSNRSENGKPVGDGVKVWDTQTGQELLTIKEPGWVFRVAFSLDGKRLASAGTLGTKLWDAQTGQELLSFKGNGPAVAMSPDGKRVASGGREVKVWDAQTGQQLFSLRGHVGDIYSLAFSPDGKRLASGSEDKTVKIWDAQTGQEVLTLKGHAGVPILAFSADGYWLGSADWAGTVKIWDATPVAEKR